MSLKWAYQTPVPDALRLKQVLQKRRVCPKVRVGVVGRVCEDDTLPEA